MKRIIAMAMGAVIAACGSSSSSNDGSGPADGTAGATENEALAITVSSGDLAPGFSPDVHDYTLTSLTTLAPVTVTVRGARVARAGDLDLTDGQPHGLPAMTSIPADGTIAVAVQKDGASSTYTIHMRPADFTDYTVKVDGPTPGHVFLAPFDVTNAKAIPYLLVVDELGNLLHYTRLTNPRGATDWKRQLLPDGTVRYTYFYLDDLYVLDEKFAILEKHRLQATDAHGVYAPDGHDFRLLGPSHFVMMAYVNKTVTNIPDAVTHPIAGAKVVAAVVQEVDNGNVVFEWDSTDHPELYALSTDGNDFMSATTAADYAHMNAIELDPTNGNFVLSFRHLDSILEVSRADGSIVWRLGNENDSFGTTSDEKSSHQHFVRFLTDGRLQMFDNGNAEGASRVLTFGLDPARHAVTSFDTLPLGGYYARAMGSAMPVGASSEIVGLGIHADGQPDVVEIDRSTGKHTFELAFANGLRSYRAIKQ